MVNASRVAAVGGVVPGLGLGLSITNRVAIALPTIQLSASSVTENAATSTKVADISVSNGSAAGAFSISAQTPSGKLKIVGTELQVNATIDREANPTLSVTITDGVLSRTFEISVTNQFEVTLGALALGGLPSPLVIGTPASGSITGASAVAPTSTIVASGLPSGLTINSAARTWAWSGSGSVASGTFSLTETHSDGTNSPRTTSGLGWSVAAAPTETFVTLILHGDSNTPGIFPKEAEDTNDTRIRQYATGTGGTPADGYNVIGGTGLQANVFPIQHPFAYGGTPPIAPGNYAAKRIIAEGEMVSVDIVGVGVPGAEIVGDIGPLPAYATSYGVPKASAAWAAREAASPGAEHIGMGLFLGGFNDQLHNRDPDEVLTKMTQVIADYRDNVTGFDDAKFVVSSTTPEHASIYGTNGYKIDAALRIAALKSGGYFCQLPTGLGLLHLGEGLQPGGYNDPQVARDAGYDHIGRVTAVALGLINPIMPTITVTNGTQHQEGANTTITLSCDQPVYWWIDPATSDGSGALHPTAFELSADLEFLDQKLRPAGGTWPAYDAGTPANNTKRVKLNYRTGDGVVGSITRSVGIIAVEADRSATILWSGQSTSPVDQAFESGKEYLLVLWGDNNGGAVSVSGGGSLTAITNGSGYNVRHYRYVPTSNGSKTVTPQLGNGLLFILEIEGGTYNGTSTVIPGFAGSGPFEAPGSVTDFGVCVFVATGGVPDVNMSFVATAGGNFHLFTSPTTVTPSGSWNGSTALAAVGFS